MIKDLPPFRDDVVRQLATLLNETDLTEIEYEVEGCRIRVARQLSVAPVSASVLNPLPSPSSEGTVTRVNVEKASPLSTSTSPESGQATGVVKAPMVGTAYMAATPGGAPFVHVGDQVTKGQTLMIIEAMKVMNQIKAPHDGTIKQILVKDADPIEYGQALFIIE
jgi:acetyl-CoA carboxylase biotin carboxyl carrier protein